MRVAERRIVNILEMKCLRSLVGVSRMDDVRNAEVHRRVGIVRDVDEFRGSESLRWYVHVERMVSTIPSQKYFPLR